MRASAQGALLLLTLALLAGCAPGFSRVTPREVVRDEDLGLAYLRGANRDAGDFSEQLVLRGALADGGRFHARLLVTNLAGADGRAQLSLTIHDGQGRRLAWSHKAARGDWAAAEGRLEVTFGEAPPRDGPWARLAVGVGWATLEVEDPDADLRLSATVRGPRLALQPEGGAMARGSQSYVTLIPVPRGQLTLEITAPSATWVRVAGGDPPEAAASPSAADGAQAERGATAAADRPDDGAATPGADRPDDSARIWDANGIGYVEQRHGNIPPHDLARRWYNVASLGEDVTLVLSASEAPPAPSEPGAPARPPGQTRGWLFAASDDGLLLYAPTLTVRAEGFSPDSETRHELPEVVRIAAPDIGLRGVFALGPLSARTDDLASLSKLERLVVRRFMQPWTFRFNGARWLLRQQRGLEAARDLRGEGTFLFQQVRP
jgi:hypothetical protein